MLIRIDLDEGSRYFILRFQYDAKTIQIVRGIQGRKWDTEHKCWLVPVAEFETIKKLLPEHQLSDKVKQYLQSKDIVYSYDLSGYQFKTKPYQHQIIGLETLLRYRRFGITDEMGLGKTKTAIDFIDYMFEQEKVKKVLVVCSKSLKWSWKEEFALHSKYNLVQVIANDKKERLKDIRSINNFSEVVYIATYDTVRLEIENLKKIQWDIIVLDEVQKIKNHKALRTKAIYNLNSSYKVFLSGTFVANKPEDCWSPIYWVRPDLIGSYYGFLDKYCVMGEYGIEGYKNLDQLKKIIAEVTLHRTKAECLDLPAKIYRNVPVELGVEQRKLYNKMRDDMVIRLQAMDEQEYIYEAGNILVQLLRLVQLASNPRLLDGVDVDSAKFEVVDDLLEECMTNGNKVIIWSSFVKNIDYLWYTYKDRYGAEKIYGNTSEEDRKKIQDRFKNDSSCRLLIANPATAGEGLNLQSANTAIFVDRTFSKTHWLQAQDRIHRIGQSKTCEIITLTGIDTIDEYVAKSLREKQEVADFLEGNVLPSKTELSEVI
jgi:SNF2 family DNA or RNA helicase